MFFNLGGTDTSSGVAMTQAHASSQLMRAKHDQLTLIDLYNNCNFDQEAYYEDGRIRFRDRPKDYSNEIQELKQETKELKSILEKEKIMKDKIILTSTPMSGASIAEIYKPITPEEQIKRLENENRDLNETIIKLIKEHEEHLLNEKRRPYKINIEGILKGTNVPEEKILEIVDYIIDRVEDDEESNDSDYDG